MKKTYEKPEIQVVDFEIEDIITTSGAGDAKDVSYWGTSDPAKNALVK